MCPSLGYHSSKPWSLGRIAGEMVGVKGKGEEEEASSYPVVPLVSYPARECGGQEWAACRSFLILLLLLLGTAGETILFCCCFCYPRVS